MVLVVPACPVCKEPGIPLLFGLPVPEARKAADAGQLALAGCIMPDDPPNWQCRQGHQWRHDDEEAWNAQLLNVLIAHGYEPLPDEVES
jgi:hypothetical protein